MPFRTSVTGSSFMWNKCAKQQRPVHRGQPSTAGGLWQGTHHCDQVVWSRLQYSSQINIVSVTSLTKRPLACIYHLLLGKAVLVSGLSKSSRAIRAIKGQGHSTVAISCYCRASNHSKQGEDHSQYTVTHTLPKLASSNSSVSVTSVSHL